MGAAAQVEAAHAWSRKLLAAADTAARAQGQADGLYTVAVGLGAAGMGTREQIRRDLERFGAAEFANADSIALHKLS